MCIRDRAGNIWPPRTSGSQNSPSSTPARANATVTRAEEARKVPAGSSSTTRSAQTEASVTSPSAAAANPWFWPVIWASSFRSVHCEQGVGRPRCSGLTWSTIASVTSSARRSKGRMSVISLISRQGSLGQGASVPGCRHGWAAARPSALKRALAWLPGSRFRPCARDGAQSGAAHDSGGREYRSAVHGIQG